MRKVKARSLPHSNLSVKKSPTVFNSDLCCVCCLLHFRRSFSSFLVLNQTGCLPLQPTWWLFREWDRSSFSLLPSGSSIMKKVQLPSIQACMGRCPDTRDGKGGLPPPSDSSRMVRVGGGPRPPLPPLGEEVRDPPPPHPSPSHASPPPSPCSSWPPVSTMWITASS